MKTQKTTSLVEVTHWTCAVDGHSHKRKDVAERCIEKHLAPNKSQRRWTREMIADVCAAIVAGATYKSVADSYGVRAPRIQKVYSKGIRMMIPPARLVEPFPDHDIHSVAEVRANADFWNRQIARLRSAP